MGWLACNMGGTRAERGSGVRVSGVRVSGQEIRQDFRQVKRIGLVPEWSERRIMGLGEF
jgi:hypothetical protein